MSNKDFFKPHNSPQYSCKYTGENDDSFASFVCNTPMMQQNGSKNNQHTELGGKNKSAVITLIRSKAKKPNHYQVILLNDDYTPMDFVVQVLMMFFNKTIEESIQLMLQVHNDGKAVCGIFPHEIAETKVMQVTMLARQQEYPLRCTMEKKL